MSKYSLLQYLKNKKKWTELARRGPFRIFQHPLLENIKKLKGGPFGEFFLKSYNAEKTQRGPCSLSRYGMLRGKRGKTFLVQFSRPNDLIWDHKFRRTFKNHFGQFE